MHGVFRRAAEVVFSRISEEPGDRPQTEVNSWLVGLFVVLTIALVIALSVVLYTFGEVIVTLTVVEDSSPDLYLRVETEDEDDDNVYKNNVNWSHPGPAPAGPALAGPAAEAPLLPPKPITSSIRTTIRHIRARAGPWSIFRGLKMALFYAILRSILVQIFARLLGRGQGMEVLYSALVSFFVEMLLANLYVAWIHIVISEPSSKRFFQRIPGRKAWLKIAPVAALKNFVPGVAFFIPLVIILSVTGQDVSDIPDNPTPAYLLRLLGILSGPTLLFLVVSIPVHAIFIRVAASMLPEDDESIVPFDRSFKGKVTPVITGGSGMVGIKDAWTTFDWAARIRYLKVSVKVFILASLIFIAFVLSLVGLLYVLGPDAVKNWTTAIATRVA